MQILPLDTLRDCLCDQNTHPTCPCAVHLEDDPIFAAAVGIGCPSRDCSRRPAYQDHTTERGAETISPHPTPEGVAGSRLPEK